MKNNISQEYLKEVIRYNPKTGVFLRNEAFCQNKKLKNTGTINAQGYLVIKINNKAYRAHRLAFLYMTGAFPKNLIDHKNGDKSDNRWENLREASDLQNNRNAKRRKDNTSGYKGVNYVISRGKWEARCRTPEGRKHIGHFNTKEEAAMAYQDFAKKCFGEFYTTR